MRYREIIAAFYEIHTKPINSLWEQNIEFLILNLVLYIATAKLQRVKTASQHGSTLSAVQTDSATKCSTALYLCFNYTLRFHSNANHHQERKF